MYARMLACGGLLTAAATLLACEGIPLAPQAIQPPPVGATITLTLPDTVLSPGQEVQARVQIRAADGTTLDAAGVVWRSVDPTTATITASGVVRAQTVGRTLIVSRAVVGTDTIADTVPVRVVSIPAVRLAIWPRDTVMLTPDTLQLRTSILDSAGHELGLRNVRWTLSDTTKALLIRTTETTARLYPKTSGIVELTAKTDDGVTTRTTVRMEPDTVHQVRIQAPPTATLDATGTQTFDVTTIGVSSRGRSLPGTVWTYSLSNASVISLTASFRQTTGELVLRFMPKAVGQTMLVVTIDGVQEAVRLTIVPAA